MKFTPLLLLLACLLALLDVATGVAVMTAGSRRTSVSRQFSKDGEEDPFARHHHHQQQPKHHRMMVRSHGRLLEDRLFRADRRRDERQPRVDYMELEALMDRHWWGVDPRNVELADLQRQHEYRVQHSARAFTMPPSTAASILGSRYAQPVVPPSSRMGDSVSSYTAHTYSPEHSEYWWNADT